MVMEMTIYLDLIFLLNFSFDFLLLMSVSIILKRHVKLLRIVLGALLGGLSIFSLFFHFNTITLFLFKIIISIMMILITFSYKSSKYFGQNILYLYMSSIILGGFIYFLNLQFSYKNKGLIFFHKGLSINFILLIIFGPIILYIYIKQCHKMKIHYSDCHKVTLYLASGEQIYLNGYLDTGNKLYDPYSKKPIILVYSKKLNFDYENSLLIPYTTLDKKGIIPCQKIKKMVIDGKQEWFDVLVGKSKEPFNIEGIDCILHSEYMEE